MKVLVIIPARYESTRFLGKPLVDIGGKSMIQRVYEQATKASLVDKVVVATDDQRIFNHLNDLNYHVEMTNSTHQSGTDRCAEVATRHVDFDIIINVQGDEPFIAPSQIDKVIEPLQLGTIQISTLAKQITDYQLITNNNTVKLVKAQNGNALYFSRSPIPFVRGKKTEEWLNYQTYYQHIGLYGFHRKTLLELTQLPQSELEKAESLEQLRWLENGYSIKVEITQEESFGIDTPEDLERAKNYLQSLKKQEE